MSDFQRGAGEQGRMFEQVVETLLLIDGFEIKERHLRHPEVDVEIDLVAWREDVGEIWVECKGSWRSASGRNGLRRTDTVKKAIANAALLATVDDPRPYWLIASHLPEPESIGAQWLTRLTALFDRVRDVGIAP